MVAQTGHSIPLSLGSSQITLAGPKEATPTTPFSLGEGAWKLLWPPLPLPSFY